MGRDAIWDAGPARGGTWPRPSFSRQTGLSCSACHYQFPQLTPFGRLFKLNGYSLVGLKVIREPNAKTEAPLSLLPIPPLAMMLMTSERI